MSEKYEEKITGNYKRKHLQKYTGQMYMAAELTFRLPFTEETLTLLEELIPETD